VTVCPPAQSLAPVVRIIVRLQVIEYKKLAIKQPVVSAMRVLTAELWVALRLRLPRRRRT
jgi:hypothetical protein